MQVQATNTTTNVQETQAQQSSVEKSSKLFDILVLNNTKPTDITYDEYKNLSVEDIEKLYDKESIPEAYDKAIALHSKANASNDEILNEVLFDKELESYGSEAQKAALGHIDAITNFWESLQQFTIAFEKANQYMKDNNVPFSMEALSKIHSQMMEETVVPENKKKITAEELFESFDMAEKGYRDNYDYYKNSSSKFYSNAEEIFHIYDSIQAEYEKRVSENNNVLNNYTKNTKPYALAI